MSYPLIAKLYDPTYSEKIDTGGPLPVVRAEYEHVLDGAGRGTVEFPGQSLRVLRHVQELRVLELQAGTRRVGAFVIEEITPIDAPGSYTLRVAGTSLLLRLAQRITWPGTVFEAVTLESIYTALADLAGFTVSVSTPKASDLMSTRFDGENPQRGFAVLSQMKGLHFRESLTATEIEVGEFGADAGVYVDYVENSDGSVAQNANNLLLERLTIQRTATDVVNYALGLGGGDGDTALTMELAMPSRSFVERVTVGGRDHWVYQNTQSVADYDVIQRRVNVKRLVPTSPGSTESVRNASIALADAIQTFTDRHAFPQEVFQMRLRNVQQTIRPGDKLHIRYRGMMNQIVPSRWRESGEAALPYRWRDIDGDFWVLTARESLDASGVALDLTVSNIDRYQDDELDILVGMMDDLYVQNVRVQTTPSLDFWGLYQKEMDSSNPVTLTMRIRDYIQQIISVPLIIRRDVFTTTAKSAQSVTSAGGGNHHHRMFTYNPNIPGGFFGVKPYIARQSNGGAFNDIKLDTANTQDIWTEGASGDHTHTIPAANLVYGIERDTEKPENVTLSVDGVAVASFFLSGSSSDVYEIDIADYLKDNEGQIIRGDHTIELTCTAGQGELELSAPMRVIYQPYF